MNDEREYELEIIAPYKKALKPGDVFAMKFDEHLFVHGRVVRTDAYWTPSGESAGLANLVYIYDHLGRELGDYNLVDLVTGRMLIPPVMTNRQGWSRGYFTVVEHAPLTSGDVLERHVFHKGGTADTFFDDMGNKVDRGNGPVGLYGLASFRAIQKLVLDALGLKCKIA